MRSIYSIPGALTNHHKYTGQEHREGDQREGIGTTSRARLKETNQKAKRDVQRKDVEDGIKGCDERRRVGR